MKKTTSVGDFLFKPQHRPEFWVPEFDPAQEEAAEVRKQNNPDVESTQHRMTEQQYNAGADHNKQVRVTCFFIFV